MMMKFSYSSAAKVDDDLYDELKQGQAARLPAIRQTPTVQANC